MKENQTKAGRAPSADPGPEGPAAGMATRQDPAQGAQAAGPQGDITAGGSIFGPDGAGQFVRLGEGKPREAEPKPQPKPTPAAAAFTRGDPGGGNGQGGQPIALLAGQPMALLEAKTIDRLRRRLFDKRRTHGPEARQLPEGTSRARSRSAWTKTITETITAIQAFQAGPPPARPDGKMRIDPRKLSRSWKGRIIAYFVFEQPEVPNTAIADLVEMTPSAVGWRRRQIIEGEARPELVNTGAWQIMSRLAIRKDHLQRKAIGEKDYGLAWRIETEYIEKLQELGLIPKQPIQIETKSESRNFSIQVQEFIHAFGAIPTPAEFLSALRKPGSGDGNGNGDGSHGQGLLEGPPGRANPARDAGGPPPDRDPHRR